MATTTQARPAHLHYRYAELAGQLLAVLLIGLICLAALLVNHYGDASTFNEGYTLGGDTSAVQLGVETRGAPGLFGDVKTPLGVASYATGADGGVFWCPAGETDIQCGA
jgi:hypothetical protein